MLNNVARNDKVVPKYRKPFLTFVKNLLCIVGKVFRGDTSTLSVLQKLHSH